MLYDMRRRVEYEANVFAADLLVGDDEVLELANCGYDMRQIAGELDADPNIALIKLDSQWQQGYSVCVPYRPPSDFLGE